MSRSEIMTFLIWYFGGAITALILNYTLHQPNKEWDKKIKEPEDRLRDDSKY